MALGLLYRMAPQALAPPRSGALAAGAHAASRSSRLPQVTPPLPRAAALVTLVAVPALAATLVTTWSPCASVCPGLTLITAASVLTPAVVAAPFAAPAAMPDAAAGGPWLNSAPPPGGVTGPVLPLGVPPPPPAEGSPAVQGVCADSVCGVGPCGAGVVLGVLLGVLDVLGPGLGVLVSAVDPFAPTCERMGGAVRHGAQCRSRPTVH